jgi:hypothetical protein
MGGDFVRAESLQNLDAPMTLSIAHPTETASPMRGLLPLWVGVVIYALLVAAGC